MRAATIVGISVISTSHMTKLVLTARKSDEHMSISEWATIT